MRNLESRLSRLLKSDLYLTPLRAHSIKKITYFNDFSLKFVLIPALLENIIYNLCHKVGFLKEKKNE